jgi:hypothetical protein
MILQGVKAIVFQKQYFTGLSLGLPKRKKWLLLNHLRTLKFYIYFSAVPTISLPKLVVLLLQNCAKRLLSFPT